MSNNNNVVQVLETRELFDREFNIYGTKEEPLFLARDIAEMIDYQKTKEGKYKTSVLMSMVDDDEKIKLQLQTNFKDPYKINVRENIELWFVTEDGLYEILMRSNKPIAKDFRKQVKKILKEIRLEGGYLPIGADESEDDFLARAFVIAQNKLAKRDAELKQAKEQIQIDAPKVEYYENVMTTDETVYSFTDLISELDLNYRKAEDLSRALYDAKVIHYPNGKKEGFYLTANYCGKGYLKTYSFIKKTLWGDKIINAKGWSAKGREFIWELSQKGII